MSARYLGAAWCWATIEDGADVRDYSMGRPAHWQHLDADDAEAGA